MSDIPPFPDGPFPYEAPIPKWPELLQDIKSVDYAYIVPTKLDEDDFKKRLIGAAYVSMSYTPDTSGQATRIGRTDSAILTEGLLDRLKNSASFRQDVADEAVTFVNKAMVEFKDKGRIDSTIEYKGSNTKAKFELIPNPDDDTTFLLITSVPEIEENGGFPTEVLSRKVVFEDADQGQLPDKLKALFATSGIPAEEIFDRFLKRQMKEQFTGSQILGRNEDQKKEVESAFLNKHKIEMVNALENKSLDDFTTMLSDIFGDLSDDTQKLIVADTDTLTSPHVELFDIPGGVKGRVSIELTSPNIRLRYNPETRKMELTPDNELPPDGEDRTLTVEISVKPIFADGVAHPQILQLKKYADTLFPQVQ